MSKILEQIMSYLSGSRGCAYYNSTNTNVGSFKAFIVNDSCVFETLEINGVSVLSSMNLSGVTLKTGMYITSNQNAFTRFKLASGSVIAYF
jgi:hypothetical protein